MNNSNKAIQTTVTPTNIATVGAVFKKPSKEYNLHVLPLKQTACIHGIVFTPYVDAEMYIKVRNVGRNTKVFVEDGEMESLAKRTATQSVVILNRGLVENNTAIEIDVIKETFGTPSPKKPFAGKNTISFLKKAMVSTTISLLSMPLAAATTATADSTDWLLLGGATIAIYLLATIATKRNKSKWSQAELNQMDRDLEERYDYETKVLNSNELLCIAYRNGWKPEQIAKRWNCSVAQVKKMANRPNKYQTDAFIGLPWNGDKS